MAAGAQLGEQMCTDESGCAGDGDTKRTHRGDTRLERFGQELLPVEELAAAAASREAAYIRRACERDGFPDDVRGNA